METKINQMFNEDNSRVENCYLCNEVSLKVGEKTKYGSIIIFRIGEGDNGWFATLSPKTGSDPKKDFCVQLMTMKHFTHFSQIANYPELAKNYGIAFSKISQALTKIMALENPNFEITSPTKESSISVASYGKCTNWEEKKEHVHIKIFPFRGNIGQPYTVDSSFGKKEIYKNSETNEKFIKMIPVTKSFLTPERLEKLSKQLIQLL